MSNELLIISLCALVFFTTRFIIKTWYMNNNKNRSKLSEESRIDDYCQYCGAKKNTNESHKISCFLIQKIQYLNSDYMITERSLE